jgi:hypothetical protein
MQPVTYCNVTKDLSRSLYVYDFKIQNLTNFFENVFAEKFFGRWNTKNSQISSKIKIKW